MELDTQRALDVAQTEEILRGVLIPPRPALLVEILEEQNRPEPNLDRIAHLVSEDVALAASTLKLVNSPLFGLSRPVMDIGHAVRMLGLRNIVNLVTALLLHQAFRGTKGALMERFWRQAEWMAHAATLVARKSRVLPQEEAYTLGLFCDCGIPLLLRRFPEYAGVFEAAEREAQMRPSIEVEHERLRTDHAAAGFLLARAWKLPSEFCQAILRHHDPIDYYQAEKPESVVTYLAVLMVAQHLVRQLLQRPPSAEWQAVGASVQRFLGLSDEALILLAQSLKQLRPN
jgi:HD-like signal output (HDOD) protein